jgi:hypothetical protein
MAQQATLFAQPHRNECVFSECRRYRYSLRRVVNPVGAGVCLWVMANPSVADEYRLDPTLTRCADYTERWGFAEMLVVNVRAWVSTDPDAVPDDPLAIGPGNWITIAAAVAEADVVVCGYGKLGGALGVEALELIPASSPLRQPCAARYRRPARRGRGNRDTTLY